jgi:hypothetical protein
MMATCLGKTADKSNLHYFRFFFCNNHVNLGHETVRGFLDLLLTLPLLIL